MTVAHVVAAVLLVVLAILGWLVFPLLIEERDERRRARDEDDRP